MGKSAKAMKRPSKHQKEIRKIARVQVTDHAPPAANPGNSSRNSSGGGSSSGVTKRKSPRVKAKAVAAAAASAALPPSRRSKKPPSSDYLRLFTKNQARAAQDVVDSIHGWGVSGAMLSVARSSAAAASVGHLALFAGGRLQNSSYTDVVDIYDRESNKWSTAHLSANRSGVGAGTLAGRYALFAGGHDAKFRPMSLVDVFDSQTKQWSQIHLHTPRASPRLLDLGNVTAVVGGLSGDLQYLSRAVEYIDARLSVSAPASLGGGYPQLGIPMVDRGRGIGLYTSGYQNNRPGDRFNDFQPSNQTTTFTASGSAAELTAGPVFPSPRWGAGGAAAEGVFVVGGGHTFNDGTDGGSLTSVTDRVDIYRAAERKWSSTPLRLSVPRDYPLVQVVGRYIVFASGTQQSKDLDIFDLQAHAFVQNLQHRPALHTLRSDAVAVTVDNCLLVIAGGTVYQGRNTTASVEFFDACPK